MCRAADIAIEREYEYYFWGHSDVAVFPQNATMSFADVAVSCADAATSAIPNWGIMYFMYDWFSAIRTDLVRQVNPFLYPWFGGRNTIASGREKLL